MLDTAYLIWKTWNERRVRDNDSQERGMSEAKILNGWTHTIGKRLTIYRVVTNDMKFGKGALR